MMVNLDSVQLEMALGEANPGDGWPVDGWHRMAGYLNSDSLVAHHTSGRGH